MTLRGHPVDPADALLRRTRRRLALVTLLTVIALVVAMGAATAVAATRFMTSGIDRSLDAAVRDPLLVNDLLESDDEEDHRTSPLGGADTFVMLVDADGVLVGDSSNVRIPGLPDREAVLAAAASGEDRRQGTYGGVPVRLLTTRMPDAWIEDDDEGRVPAYLQAGFNLSVQQQAERELLLVIATVGLLGIVGAIVVTIVVTHRALVPIREAFATERRFVAAASHELRTPVSIIRASAEILDRERLVTGDGRTLVDDIVGETERLGRLVGDMLALASVEAGAVTLDARPIELAGWWDDLCRRIRSMVEGTGLVFEARAEPAAMSAVVVADRDRLDQIVLVLVDNAVNHSPAGGTVTLALAADRAHRSVLVTVSDQGPGIPPDQRERIFEPFARLRGPGSVRRDRGPDDRGSGLGLAIARQLAARQGATLAVVDGSTGAGAVLRLTLPLASGGSQARTTAEPGPAA